MPLSLRQALPGRCGGELLSSTLLTAQLSRVLGLAFGNDALPKGVPEPTARPRCAAGGSSSKQRNKMQGMLVLLMAVLCTLQHACGSQQDASAVFLQQQCIFGRDGADDKSVSAVGPL